MKSNIKLIYNDIVIRDISINDCNQEYVDWLNNKNINKYLETRWYMQDLNSIKEFVKKQIDSADSYLFAITYKTKHIGNIKIGPINSHYNCCDISYFIGDENFHSKGIASKAIELVSDFGFKKIGLHRIQATLFDENIASKKALEKAGFVYEGFYHEKGISPMSKEYCDILIYYKLDNM